MRTMKNKTNRAIVRFLVLCFSLWTVLCFGPAVTAYAKGSVDQEHEASLSLYYQKDGTNLPGVEFSIYRVADISDEVLFTLSGSFAKYPVNLKNLDSEGWYLAARTLNVYVTADHITPVKTAVTDENGKLSFDGLTTGLYLLTGSDKTLDTIKYTVSPTLISLPGLEENNWIYDVSVIPKCDAVTVPSGGSGGGSGNPPGNSGSQKVTVIKAWEDEGGQSLRPSTISVTLLRNGEDYKTVTLSASNQWRHTWSGLSTDASWSVVEEDVPEPYMVTYSGEDTVLMVTNTITYDIIDQLVPLGPPGSQEIPLAGLPQTGLMQWPVLPLTAVGLLLFAFGWRERYGKRSGKDEK